MPTTIRTNPPSRDGAETSIPPLQNGDRLSRVEFERRYAAMPHSYKAELIEGTVYLMSPPVSNEHSEPHFDLIFWLGLYCFGSVGVAGADNGTLLLDLDNEPQPDAFLRIKPEFGGMSRVSADNYIEGAPELVAEIAASSASYDLHAKLNAYRRNGVPEYVVWRVLDKTIDWFILRDGTYSASNPAPMEFCAVGSFPVSHWMLPRWSPAIWSASMRYCRRISNRLSTRLSWNN